MSKCHSVGAWIRIYYVLCSKTYSTFGSLFWSPAGLRWAVIGTCICETHLLWVSITSGNGLVPSTSGTKPLPDPMLSYYQWGPQEHAAVHDILLMMKEWSRHFNIKLMSYQYGNSHAKDKRVLCLMTVLTIWLESLYWRSFSYGSGHETVAVLLPGFAISW